MAGTYYHPFNKPLTTAQMQVNAIWLRDYLTPRGWSINAIAACLGNWQSESTINPNRCSNKGYPNNSGGAFGLPQWSPYNNKYSPWCKAQGIAQIARDDNPAGTMEAQIAFHEYDCKYGYNGKKTWYNNKGYSYTWENFKRSTDPPDRLASAYYYQYERSKADATGTRPSQAVTWYNYLIGQPYNPISSKNFINRPGIMSQSPFGNLSFIWVIYLIILLLGGKKRK